VSRNTRITDANNLGRVTQQTQTIAGLTPTIVFNQVFDAASNRTELARTVKELSRGLKQVRFRRSGRWWEVHQKEDCGGRRLVRREKGEICGLCAAARMVKKLSRGLNGTKFSAAGLLWEVLGVRIGEIGDDCVVQPVDSRSPRGSDGGPDAIGF